MGESVGFGVGLPGVYDGCAEGLHVGEGVGLPGLYVGPAVEGSGVGLPWV